MLLPLTAQVFERGQTGMKNKPCKVEIAAPFRRRLHHLFREFIGKRKSLKPPENDK
jgi:hypothetical protein